ncbi:hypothetical protein [Oleiharenicola lentus]|uniref:hypothetical protein n=1 Tax=Oleiharenicola lentus TaxID=2508720 RepID=UPI003F663F79
MIDLPPLLRDQRKADADHLRLLAVFHFVVAGLSVVGLGLVALHYTFMRVFFMNPDMWKDQKSAPPPVAIMDIFKWFYLVFAVLLVVVVVGNLLSGLFIGKRKHRMFSLVVGGINCLQFPFGTALGVFTLVVLTRDSVRESYEANQT